MHDQWRRIWQQKQRDSDASTALASLLAMDGYDGFGGIDETAWLNYIDHIALKLDIRPADSIFEVGCGAGAFLQPWYARGHRVGGIDYADNMAKAARQAMPQAAIEAGDASQLECNPRYDIVLAQSVFFYFPDHAYAAAVLRKMIDKADRVVAILDVADQSHREEALRQRRASLGAEAYARKYAGLDHLYYDRHWFLRAIADMDLRIELADQYIRGYHHNAYRFNVFIFKPEMGLPPEHEHP